METSPPVRDIRNRANRNKCIVVAVTSAVILAAVVIIIAYITHFSSTELTPDSATALIDEAISKSRNDSVLICTNYEIVLKENDTSLIDRVDKCSEATAPERDDLDKRNETDEPVPRPNIICKLSTAQIRVATVSNTTRQLKNCKFNSTIVVEFAFNTDNKVQNVTFHSEKSDSPNSDRRGQMVVGLLDKVEAVLREDILQLVGGYATADARVEDIPANWDQICRAVPWDCKY